MMKNTLALLLAAGAFSVSAANFGPDTSQAQAVASQVSSYLPGVSGFGTVKVKKVNINDATRHITVTFSEAAQYIPFTTESLNSFKSDIVRALGQRYAGYSVSLKTDDNDLSNLVLFAPKVNQGPTETLPFITRAEAAPAPQGLDGSNIAMWQSHGWYFEPKLNRWEWQRARIFQTVEDLYTQSYVMPFLMPMLENAGAYVLSPRERDTNTTEIIVDNDGGQATGRYSEQGGWGDAGTGFAYSTPVLTVNQNPFREGTARKAPTNNGENRAASASWTADIPEAGTYAVYVSYVTLPNSSTAAKYTVNAANGPHHFTVNQRMGGGTWIYLGHFPFKAGEQTIVELDNSGTDSRTVVTADAVKIGGGMGNVARIVGTPKDSINYHYTLSNYPRFTEAARYFMQWAGVPDSVYTSTGNENDYTDDYKSRGMWVNWLTGGSSMLPDREGLNIPIDLSFAFHTDAGTTMNDSIIGTLGIYSTLGDTLGNGSSRLTSRDLTDLIMTEIVKDVRAEYEPNWSRRGMWDKTYFEARVPQVPAMLLELLSHQNFADMGYGLDPNFRFTVSRAIYKGMGRFIAQRDGREFVVQPLAVNTFGITKSGANEYTLSWVPTEDAGEPTAAPTYYIIEERVGTDGAFRQIARTDSPSWTTTVSDTDIHSYRVIAANDGGISFPSEVLALCNLPGEPVVIVNGFTRVSAPDRFNSGEIAGFYDVRDHGVPYIKDISFIGSQFEFRRDIPWMDDDAAGFGASRSNYEDKVIAGNTFDYPVIHGAAIAATGRGFISMGVDAFIASDSKPAVVDLILGKQKEIIRGRGVFGTYYKTFPAPLQSRMSALADQGTAFFVSGSYIATDLWDNPNSDETTAAADQAFARKVLGYNWRVGQASVTGQAYQVDNRYKDFTGGNYDFSNTLNPDMYVVESPDSFYGADASTTVTMMRYTENNLVAGTAMDGATHRAVAIGFPFETIDTAEARENLMRQILNFFADPTPRRERATHETTLE